MYTELIVARQGYFSNEPFWVALSTFLRLFTRAEFQILSGGV